MTRSASSRVRPEEQDFLAIFRKAKGDPTQVSEEEAALLKKVAEQKKDHHIMRPMFQLVPSKERPRAGSFFARFNWRVTNSLVSA